MSLLSDQYLTDSTLNVWRCKCWGYQNQMWKIKIRNIEHFSTSAPPPTSSPASTWRHESRVQHGSRQARASVALGARRCSTATSRRRAAVLVIASASTSQGQQGSAGQCAATHGISSAWSDAGMASSCSRQAATARAARDGNADGHGRRRAAALREQQRQAGGGASSSGRRRTGWGRRWG